MREDPLAEVDPRALGARLREAREARGLTQHQAAERLGVARTTMVAIEKGERRVQPEELINLAALYARRIADLLQRGAPVEGFAVQLRGSLPPAEPIETELLPKIQEFQELCEDYVRLEGLRRAPLRRRYPPVYELGGVDADLAAEDVAAQERRRLGVGEGPLLGLREVLENDVGLRVFALALPSKVAGMYAFTEEMGGCIAFNRDHPPERQRHSLAHEYGHFLTSRYRSEVLRTEHYQRQPAGERFAEGFARAFLLPAEGMRRRFLDLQRERAGSPTFGDLCRLAHLFAVSVEAMLRRLEELGLIPAGSWDRLKGERFRVREAQQLLGLESLAGNAELLPARFLTLAMEAWYEEQLSEGQLAQVLRVSRLEARERLDALRATSSGPSGPFDFAEPLVGSSNG